MTASTDPHAVRLARAEKLLDGEDPAAGQALLHELASAGVAAAMVRLSNRLWEGRGLPRDVTAAEAWLRRAADAADPLAMLVLGQRLLYGMGLARDPLGAEAPIERAAIAGFAPAMEALAGLLRRAGREDEGLAWLERAAEAGHLPAMTDWGLVAIARGQVEAGEAWLERAAARSFGRALGLLGERLLEGARPAALDLLARAFARGELHFGLVLGLAHYQAREYAAAIAVFERAHALGAAGATLNLAYMARRGEWDAARERPDVEALLAPLVARERPDALLNLALYLVTPPQADWARADTLVARACRAGLDAGWWQQLAAAGDREGDLVLGWLARHGHPAGDASRLARGPRAPAWLAERSAPRP